MLVQELALKSPLREFWRQVKIGGPYIEIHDRANMVALCMMMISVQHAAVVARTLVGEKPITAESAPGHSGIRCSSGTGH